MSIAKKLLVLIAATMAAAFVIVAVITDLAVVENNGRIVTGITERLESDGQESFELLKGNVERIEKDLSTAGRSTREIILGLYDTSYSTLAKALANQILPMVESFDYYSPGQIIEDLMESNGAIKGVRFITGENPSAEEIHEFGSFAVTDDRRSFGHEIRGDWAYLKIDMQISLAEMQALKTVDAGFARINASNKKLLLDFEEENRLSLASATGYAVAVGKEGEGELMRLSGILMTLALIAVCSVLAYFISRFVGRPMARTVEMIEEMEKGHLDIRLGIVSGDEIGRMARAMDAFADNLQNEVVDDLRRLAGGDLSFEVSPRDERDLIRGSLKALGEDLGGLIAEIRATGERIASGSGQVSGTSHGLSEGATEQASSLEEITTSMAEMASRTRINADNAGQANLLADEARGAAEKGSVQMVEMSEAMGEINRASQDISKIIKTIDEIAFQTNLLALNAAVEAARAGQHGKGFAVVAEEVRNLAARSARAASETAELIESSVKKVTAGTGIVERTAEALEGIVAGVTKTSDLVAEISAASGEQAQGISQVNQGLSEVDRVTQQNTSAAEQSAAAAEELSSQAARMQQMLSRFTLKGQGSGGFEPAPEQAALSSPSDDVAWDFTSAAQAPEAVIALDEGDFAKY